MSARGDEGRRRHSQTATLLAMCLSLILVVASVSALNLALPGIAVEFKASNTNLTWVADGYTVALAALVLPLGALGDRWGRRSLLVAGTLVFSVAALLATTAGSIEVLILWRALMGLGAAMIMPGTLSTITAAFPPEQRASGVAVWSGFAAAGAIIGMLAAGALLEHWDWKSIFVATGATGLVAGAAAFLAPNTKDDERRRPDFVGALLSAVAIGSLVFAIIEGNDRGWTAPVVLVAAGVSALGVVAYAILGHRREEALLDPRLFGIAGFRAGAITVLVQFMAVFGFFFVGLQYLQLILSYSPLKAACALVPVAVLVVPTSRVTPILVNRFGMKLVMSSGLLALLAGMAIISRLDVDAGYGPFLAGLLVAGVGLGLAGSTGTAAIVDALPTGQQGVASAVNDATREIGSAVGIAVMGSVFARSYSNNLPDLGALPSTARQAVEDSPAAGLHAMAELASLVGQEQTVKLTDAIRVAFMNALSASLVAMCVVLLLATIAAALGAPKKVRSPETTDDVEA